MTTRQVDLNQCSGTEADVSSSPNIDQTGHPPKRSLSAITDQSAAQQTATALVPKLPGGFGITDTMLR